MRVKTVMEHVLRRFPPLYRLGSRLYHRMHGTFRSLSLGAPEALERALLTAKDTRGDDPGDYYEFGLFRGYTFLHAYKTCVDLELDKTHLFGFDSFVGLPGLESTDKGKGEFFKGQFYCSKEEVEQNLSRRGMDWMRATLIEGFYNEVLNDALRKRYPFRQAAVALLDCDLYSSTRDALRWLKPYLSNGAILLFDDWYSFGSKGTEGQPKAFSELMEDCTDLEAEELWEFPNHGKVFQLRNR